MADLITYIRSNVRLIDLIDVGIVAFIVYRLLLLIKGTRAMQMLTGLSILIIFFFLSSQFHLFMTNWFLKHFFDYLIVIVIVLFQDDLRRALSNVGKNPFFSGTNEQEERESIDEIIRAGVRLAKEKIGALVVLERETGLKNFIDTGSKLDSKIRAELIYSIFMPSSPLHDGAIIISEGKISAAGCFLPLSMDPNIDKKYGSRHRAALGITEDSDAIVVLVSEEAGQIHLVKNGKITTNLNERELKQSLSALLSLSESGGARPFGMKGWFKKDA